MRWSIRSLEGSAAILRSLASDDRQGYVTLERLSFCAGGAAGSFSSSMARRLRIMDTPAATTNLSRAEAEALFRRVTLLDEPSPADAELFRAQMLTEMARMSVEDGLVMQLHPGASAITTGTCSTEVGAGPGRGYSDANELCERTHPLLDRYGNEPGFHLILFTLDESTFSRELAPLAGHYPCGDLGPPWWFHDSPEGMVRFREHVTETAGFYNTAGFNDDTRAFLSIPGRHDVARRMDCEYLATPGGRSSAGRR